MLKAKKGVRIGGLNPQILLGIMIVNSVYEDKFKLNCVITSACDFEHSTKYSEHYQGNAVDFRTKNIPTKNMRLTIHAEINDSLPEGFVLLFEGEGTDHEHFHLAWRPKFDER